MFRVGSPGSGEQKWPQAFHRYVKNIMNFSYFTQAAGNYDHIALHQYYDIPVTQESVSEHLWQGRCSDNDQECI